MFDGWEMQVYVVARIAFAMLLGGLIGLEREIKDRPAGFRTHTLVAAAAAMLTGMGEMMLAQAQHNEERVQIDPFRLVEAVIAGVAFIGAGTMIAQRGRTIAGITTAASLLMVAVIGVTIGFGYYLLALAITALTLAVLTVLRLVERLLTDRANRANRD